MRFAEKPKNEEARLEALNRYKVMDTVSEVALDDLTKLAAAICNTPIALVSLVDNHRQWFKSKVGVEITETPRDIAFCAHGILQKDLFEVPDAALDERFSDNPLVTEGSKIRFYAGVPLVTADGYTLGMLCVNDRVPRKLTVQQSDALRILGNQVMSLLELRRTMGNLIVAQERILRTEKLSAVGQLAAGVAHEINNPLGVILGFAEAVRRKLPVKSEWEGPLSSIEREALRCKNLVQQLLLFSRTSVDVHKLFDLNQVVEGTRVLIYGRAKLARITVVNHLEAGLPPAFGNSQQLEQVVMNLATNAIDAMPEGGTLTFTTLQSSESGRDWICLKVIDTGAGIPPEIQSKIFEPFFTTKRIGEGTGLGLGLVHEIVQKHSGLIDVQSRPGCTEFCVKLPTAASAPQS